MRTLLTGFGPFRNVVDNPSARIVEHFARVGAAGHELTARVLPVSFERAAREIRALLRERRFEAAVLLGVAGRADLLRLEQFARRCDPSRFAGGGRPLPLDVDGRSAPEPAAGAPDLHPSTVELAPLLRELTAAGLPVRLSDHAGAYVCNHTYYAALQAIAAADLPVRCLFLHVPADPLTFADAADQLTLPLERQIEAVERVLAWLAAGQPERAAPRLSA